MLDGSTYPKGTSFVVLFRYMATREKYFTRAKEFIPERRVHHIVVWKGQGQCEGTRWT